MSRPARRLEVAGAAWLALEAWRGEGGHGLCYFLPLAGETPATDDRRDRRATLEPGETLAELPDATLLELHGASVPLTDTEARFEDEEGRSWLAQNVGPVWAGSGVAEGLTGVRFTSLSGPHHRLEGPAGRLAGLSPADLSALLRTLRARE